MQKLFLSSLMLFFMGLTTYAQNLDLKPGVDRWSIKTSTVVNVKTVPITDLLQLSNPITDYHKTEYGDKRIPTIVQPDSLKEGDIVSTTAWLHLVALERASDTHRDGDYHIQITNSPEWGDSCFIVEVPYPDFVNDPDLIKDKYWPKRPNQLSNRIRRIGPALRSAGISIEEKKIRGTKYWNFYLGGTEGADRESDITLGK